MVRASKEATAALRFLPKLIVPEGRLAGKRVKLASYQKQFVRGAFAKGIEAGCLSIGRGNAKTALSAGLALGHLMGEIAPQPKREIIFAARNRDQAKTAFGFLLGFIEGLPEDEQEQFTIRRGSKLEVETSENGGGLARVIAADGKSILGGAPTLAILDERAAWEREKGDALENAILSGLGKRDGRALIISTSAPDDANTFSRWLDELPPGTFVHGLRLTGRADANSGSRVYRVQADDATTEQQNGFNGYNGFLPSHTEKAETPSVYREGETNPLNPSNPLVSPLDDVFDPDTWS